MLSDYTTAELELMLIRHQERRVIFTQSKLKEIQDEIKRRKKPFNPDDLPTEIPTND